MASKIIVKINKVIPLNQLFILFGIIIIYLLINLVFINKTPIFTDEAIYVRWAQIAANDASLRYISLLDGKQPLFIWIAMIPVKLLNDSLLAVRLLSVLYGLVSIIGIYFLGRVLKNSLTGLIAASLFLTSPFFFVYNRLAIYESLISMISIYSVLFTVLLVKKPRVDLSLLLGFTIGLGLLTKSSANFFIYLLPFSLLLQIRNKFSFNKTTVFKLIGLFLLSTFIAYSMFNSLRLFPLFNMIDEKNHTFILTNKEFIQNPFYLVFGNTPALISWMFQYLTPIPFFLFILSAIYYGFKLNFKIIFLLIWVMVPFFTTAFFGKIIYPRYLLYLVPIIFVVSSYFVVEKIEKIKSLKLKLFTISIILIWPILGIMSIIINPTNSIIPENDKNQLFNDWPAGGGIEEAVEIINKASLAEKVFVGTEGTFGLLPYALEIELIKNPNVEIKGYYPVKTIPVEVLEKSKTQKTFFIYNLTQDEELFKNQNILELGKYAKGNSNTYLRIFEVK